MSTTHENVSADLLWEICRSQNALLCKRKASGGLQFSRDPLNLVNKHSRKYAGFINEKAIGISSPSSGEGLVLTTKRASKLQQPKSALTITNYGSHYPARKSYRAIVNATTKKGYRSDLRAEAVARASAIKLSQTQKKDLPAKKPRGSKAKKAAAVSEE